MSELRSREEAIAERFTDEKHVYKPFGDVIPAEKIQHLFVGQDQGKGIYGKKMSIEAGYMLVSHEHSYDHLSILSQGVGRLKIDGTETLIMGDTPFIVRAGQEHTFRAITDCVLYCIHPTDETDPEKVDEVILARP